MSSGPRDRDPGGDIWAVQATQGSVFYTDFELLKRETQ